MNDAALPRRSIRSFVLRAGRMSEAQSRALATLMPRYGIAYAPEVPQGTYGATFFGREAPLVVEIGFGMGAATAEIAAQAPEKNFLGIEVHPPGVGNLLKLIEERCLTNVRVLQHDAVEVLDHMMADESVDAFHIYFPDPWPKKRHHKRRLIQPEFVRKLCARLKPGGYLHLATDWEDYAQWMLHVLQNEPALRNTSPAGFAPKPAWRPTTKFETRGVKLGHGVWDLLFVKP